jgi:SAM-dependent methyltransferase
VLLAPRLAHGSGEDAEYRYPELAEAERRHFWFLSRTALIVSVLARYFPSARRFLDVGCGTGAVAAALSERMPGLSISAGDVLVEGLRVAHSLASRVEFVQLDIRALPWRSEFDVVGAFDVLEHLDDDREVLSQMRAATVEGGGIVVTVPQHRWLWSKVDDFSNHRRRYTRRELISRIEAAGFIVELATSFMTFILPMLIASRWTKRFQSTFDPVAELRIAASANRLMTRLCALDRAVIEQGISLPAGGSLLVVARRGH